MMHLKQFPWWMAQARKVAVTNVTLPMVWWQAFWTMWQRVLFREDTGCCSHDCNQGRDCPGRCRK